MSAAPLILIGSRRHRTSRTELKTGNPRCYVPPFPGETPPMTLVPYAIVSFALAVAWITPPFRQLNAFPKRPQMPCVPPSP